jgi:hypothetical protein
VAEFGQQRIPTAGFFDVDQIKDAVWRGARSRSLAPQPSHTPHQLGAAVPTHAAVDPGV